MFLKSMFSEIIKPFKTYFSWKAPFYDTLRSLKYLCQYDFKDCHHCRTLKSLLLQCEKDPIKKVGNPFTVKHRLLNFTTISIIWTREEFEDTKGVNQNP